MRNHIPIVNQTNNSSVNQTVSNTTVKTQINLVNNQNSQVVINNNNTHSNNSKTVQTLTIIAQQKSITT